MFNLLETLGLSLKSTEIISNILINLSVEIFIGIVLVYGFFSKKNWFGNAILVCVFIELFLFGRGNLFTAPINSLRLKNIPIESNLERVISSSDVFDYVGPHVYFNHLRVRQPFAPDLSDNELITFERLNFEVQTLPSNLHMYQNLYSVSGYSAVVLDNYANYWQSTEINSVDIKDLYDAKLKTMGVTKVISSSSNDLVKDYQDFDLSQSFNKLNVYTQSAKERAFLLNSGEVNIINYTPNNVLIHTNSIEQNRLILTDAYYPGWIARIDDNLVPILPFDGALRQVDITPGEHKVEFLYQPKSVRIGGWISLLTLGMIVSLNLYEKIKTKRVY